MSMWKAIFFGMCIIFIGAVLDLYVVTLADRWAVHKVGEIGSPSGAFFLFLPKLFYGLIVGVLTERVARRVSPRYFRVTVLFGFFAYFIWKFKATEVWVAPEFFAYFLALGPYFIFFLGFCAAIFLMKRKPVRKG
jgi:hypothetical protein